MFTFCLTHLERIGFMYPFARDFRAYARDRLRGFWGVPLAVCLVASAILTACAFIPFLGSIGSVLLVGAFELGLCTFFCRLVLGERPLFASLFDKFEIFLKACGLYLFMGLFIFLWSLLLWVPGIIAAYRYAMAPYLMAEYPTMGIREAMDRSKQMMDGHKGRLFCLHLSFIGWFMLSSLTFGILLLWIMPYYATAEAAFYMNLTGRIMQPVSQPNQAAEPQNQ